MESESNLRVSPKGIDYHFYLTGEIQEPEAYTDMFDVMSKASPEDTVFLHINTPGGYLYTAIQIIHSIKTCPAAVVGCADGEVSSAGSLIFFGCDGFIVGDYSSFLLHDGSEGIGGKANENVKAAKATAKLLKIVSRDVYGRFFAKKEIKKILAGEDMYLFAEDVAERIEKATKEEE